MVLLEQYSHQFDLARQLSKKAEYKTAHALARSVATQTRVLSHLWEEKPGQAVVVRQLLDIAIRAHVLELHMEKKMENEQDFDLSRQF